MRALVVVDPAGFSNLPLFKQSKNCPSQLLLLGLSPLSDCRGMALLVVRSVPPVCALVVENSAGFFNPPFFKQSKNCIS